jgi:hypothetical protein
MSTESFLNEYESARLENIKRNQAKLAEILNKPLEEEVEEEIIVENEETTLELDKIFNSLYSLPMNNHLKESNFQCSCCLKKTFSEYFNGPMGFNSLCLECSISFYHGNLHLNEKGKKVK